VHRVESVALLQVPTPGPCSLARLGPTLHMTHRHRSCARPAPPKFLLAQKWERAHMGCARCEHKTPPIGCAMILRRVCNGPRRSSCELGAQLFRKSRNESLSMGPSAADWPIVGRAGERVVWTYRRVLYNSSKTRFASCEALLTSRSLRTPQ
jgi:hypothetical protein